MNCVKMTINLIQRMISDEKPEVVQLIKNTNSSFEFLF